VNGKRLWPVEGVSWVDVQKFIKKFNEKEGTDKYRLPSEAEWEYACRAGTTTRYSFGDSESELDDYAWYTENSGSRSPKKGDFVGYDKDDWLENRWKGKTHSVGQKKPNSWGLYDMHGNVSEWVQDEWHDSYDGAPTDGSAWESGDGAGRVNRGGGWADDARYCRSANRLHDDPRDRGVVLGFRLLREL
jgi:formylglycine-generating enzyme required for sulfatase activity